MLYGPPAKPRLYTQGSPERSEVFIPGGSRGKSLVSLIWNLATSDATVLSGCLKVSDLFRRTMVAPLVLV